MINAWRSELVGEGRLSNRSVNKLLTILHDIFERARRTYRLPFNPVAEVEKQPRHRRVSIDVYDTEEILALVRAADSEQDGAIYLTAAFTGLRMGELPHSAEDRGRSRRGTRSRSTNRTPHDRRCRLRRPAPASI